MQTVKFIHQVNRRVCQFSRQYTNRKAAEAELARQGFVKDRPLLDEHDVPCTQYRVPGHNILARLYKGESCQ